MIWHKTNKVRYDHKHIALESLTNLTDPHVHQGIVWFYSHCLGIDQLGLIHGHLDLGQPNWEIYL